MSKTGVADACSECSEGRPASKRPSSADGAGRIGIDDTAVAALRHRLLAALKAPHPLWPALVLGATDPSAPPRLRLPLRSAEGDAAESA